MTKISFVLIALGYSVLFYWASDSLYTAFMWSPAMWTAVFLIFGGVGLNMYSFHRERRIELEAQAKRLEEIRKNSKVRRFSAR
jgi:hypothetical protein